MFSDSFTAVPASSEGTSSPPRIDTNKTHVGNEIVVLHWTPGTDMTTNAVIVARTSADDGNAKWVYEVSQVRAIILYVIFSS